MRIPTVMQFARTIYRPLRSLRRRLAGVAPELRVSQHSYKLIRLGSAYGGWTLVDTDGLYRSTIISCGLGEDASFDVEFASRYQASVVIVDPTPRAVKHFGQICEKLGRAATSSYANGGAESIEAYDLSSVSESSLSLYRKALWNEPGPIKFFAPRNPNHVSHSIVNFQNSYRTDTDFIEVEAAPVDMLLDDLGITQVPLIKLDIEGAEIEVIASMMEMRIFPDQILVEYDELAVPSRCSRTRIQSAHEELLKNGYRLINFDYPSNCLYKKLE